MLAAFSHLKTLYRSRELLRIFIASDLKVRYRRSVLGYLWGMLNPLATIAVFAFVFSHIMRFEDPRDYVLYVFSGLLPWQYFSGCLVGSHQTIINVEPLLKKVYLPKIIFPLSSILSRLIDFMFNLVAVFIIVSIIQFNPSWALVALPIALLLLIASAAALSTMLAVVTVYVRDTGHLILIITQLGFYLTPIMYPLNLIPAKYQPFLVLNPILHLIRPFQSILYKGIFPTAQEWGMAAGVTGVTCLVSLWVFHVLEKRLIFRL